MLEQSSQEDGTLLRSAQRWYESSAQEGRLGRLRAKSWERFLQLGLPQRSSEVFRYMRPHRLHDESFEQAVASSVVTAEEVSGHMLPECLAALVFVDGCYQPELSRLDSLPKALVTSDLERASRTYATFLDNQWKKTLSGEKDPLAALNGAVHRQGLFLYLGPNTVVEQPVQVLHFVTEASVHCALHPRVHLFAGRQSELSLVFKTVERGGHGYLLNSVTDVSTDEGAHVKLVYDQRAYSHNVWHFEALRGQVKGDSTLKSVALTDGTMAQRSDYHVALNGPNAEVELSGLCLLDGKREAHVNVLVEHCAPHCRSDQMFKNVLTDTSRASFEGKIYVHQAAQKTEAYQLNHNLVLSDHAQAYTKPNLEIFADDVRASHGATVGQLDAEQIFYLRSRGFSLEDARNILIHGFCEDVAERVVVDSLLSELAEKTRSFLA